SIITTKRAYEELERDGFVYTIAGKGVFVARKNTEVLREEWLRQIESHMEAIPTLAKGCGLSKADLQEMLNMIYEEDASCNMPSK
ncbi:MAG: GntR family transcriptional regulator, partial [Ruminococcus sp.]